MKGAGDRLKEVDPASWESLIHAKLLGLTGGRYPEGDLTQGGFAETLEWLASCGILEWTFRSLPGI